MKRVVFLVVGMGFGLLLTGCGPDRGGADRSTGSMAPPDTHEAEHDHAAEGPHGGHVIVLGEEQYHAELVHDASTGTVGVYLLDSAVKNPVADSPEAITLQVFKDGQFADYTLNATEEKGHFSVTDEDLCDLLLHADEVKGRLRVTIGGQDFVGVIDHSAHAEEGHDHAQETGAEDDHLDASAGHGRTEAEDHEHAP